MALLFTLCLWQNLADLGFTAGDWPTPPAPLAATSDSPRSLLTNLALFVTNPFRFLLPSASSGRKPVQIADDVWDAARKRSNILISCTLVTKGR